MRAVMLAAGIGARLGQGDDAPPKVLLRFGGRSLLQRHIDILRHCGVRELVLGLGHQAEQVHAHLAEIGAGDFVRTILNPDYRRGPITTLWSLREEFRGNEPLICMDGDVLYDHRLMECLIAAEAANCFLMDHDVEPGEEPVKLCMRDGQLVDFHKRPTEAYDYYGEWIGFLKLSPEMARRVPGATERYLADAENQLYEVAFRDLLMHFPPDSFAVEDVTGLPWVEIDFVEDVARAEKDVLPRLVPLPS